MPPKPFALPPECAPGTHRLFPHRHARLDDGRDKPCAGRFWCVKCRRWVSARPCRLPRPLRLPASWRA